MKIAVVGTGYVGLVTGTCLAESGNDVVCIDKVAAKIEMLRAGKIPIYEPGLAELVHRNARDGRLTFTTDLADGIAEAELVFIAVGTPQGDDGGADLEGIWAVGREIARNLNGPKTIVIKSTVPVGTNAELARRMAEITEVPFDVASNPEFLKEGAAIDDFNKPDRVVVGARRPEVFEQFQRPLRPVPPDRAAVPDDDARVGRDDQVRRQLHAGDQDQLHQRDGQPLRALPRRHQRGPPGDRPRPADRLQLPLPRRRLRRVVLPQGHPRRDPHGPARWASPRG